MVSMDDDGPYRGKSAFSRARDRISKSATNAREADFGKRKGGSKAEVAAGLEKSEARKAERRDRRISRKSRSRWLAIAFALLVADAVIAVIFCLLAPTDPRLNGVVTSRRQIRTVYIQGVVSLFDAIVSLLLIVHVVQGILTASLDNFLEAAATKLLQAVFFSLLQTGYPTILRISFVAFLLLLRVTAAALIFRAAFLSGILTARPARQLPRLIVSLLEMGAPVPPPGMLDDKVAQSQLYALERPLNVELVERLIRWLVPIRERAAAVGTGRRQVLLIGLFLLMMTSYSAFSEYWSIVGDQDEFFDEGHTDTITQDSFNYLASEAYSVGKTTHTVEEARPFLPANVTSSMHRVVVVILSGLRYDAFTQGGSALTTDSPSDLQATAPMRHFESLLGSESVLCKLKAELPSVSLPNWIGMLTGVRPEIHGLLGNRGPAEQQYSSLLSVAHELNIEATMIGTPWFVDLFRSKLTPLKGDGSVSASYSEFEPNTVEADANDKKREEVLFLALNTTARLILAEFSEINSAGQLHGASYEEGSAYMTAVMSKARLLRQTLDAINAPGQPPTTLIVTSPHGHLPRGGAGGNTEWERDAPFLVYRPGSDLGGLDPVSDAGVACSSGDLSTIDLAPTVSALMYMPVPRHSIGKYITAAFDRDEAIGLTSDAAYAAISAREALMGPHLFRRLDAWLWRDYYHQQHAFVAGFLATPGVNERGELDKVDETTLRSNLIVRGERGHASAYVELVDAVREVYFAMRLQAARATSVRNQFVAIFLLGLILLLACFAMQLQTFCDPLIVFVPRFKTCCKQWLATKDVRAARFTLILAIGYYVICIGLFYMYCAMNGLYWSSSIVALPENTRTFLAVCMLPGIISSYLISRIILVSYAVWPMGPMGGRPPLTTLFFFVCTEEIQAFHSIDMLYLTRFYLTLWALFGACILGVLSSRFSFIVPLVFYNKYIDESLWDFRFIVMTVQIMSTPLLAASILFLYRWQSTRVDLHAMNAIHALKVDKADRRRGTYDDDGNSQADLLSPGGSNAMLGTGSMSVVTDDEAGSSEQHAVSSFLEEARIQDLEDVGDKARANALKKRSMWRSKKEIAEEAARFTKADVKADMENRFEEALEMIDENKREQQEMVEEMEHIGEQEVGLKEELAEIIEELQANQAQINSGVKEI